MLKATFLSLSLLLAVTAAPLAAEARPQGRSHVAPGRDRRGDSFRHRRQGQWEGHQRYRAQSQWGNHRGRYSPPAQMHRRPDRWRGEGRGHERRGRR